MDSQDDNIEIRVLRMEDIHGVEKLLAESFFSDEPLNKCLRTTQYFCNGKLPPHWNGLVAKGVEMGISAVAVSTKLKEVIGCRFSLIETKTYEKIDFKTLMPCPALFYKLCKNHDLFENYNVARLADFKCLVVREDFRGKGIAQKLINKSIELVKSAGLSVVKTCATNKITIKMYDKMGYDRISEMKFGEFTHHDGYKYFDSMGDNKVVYFAKQLD